MSKSGNNPTLPQSILGNLLGDLIHYVKSADDDQSLVFVAGAIQALTGFAPEYFQAGDANTPESIILPADLKRADRLIHNQLKRAETYSVEFRIRKADGSESWIRDLGMIQQGDDGNIRVGVWKDITDERQARQQAVKLQHQAEMSANLLEAVAEGSETHWLVIDGDGQILMINDAWLAYETAKGSGLNNKQDWLDKDIYSLIQNSHDCALGSEEFTSALRKVQDGIESLCQLEICDPLSWETQWLLLSARRLRGEMSGALISRQNVTALKNAELRVQEQSTFLNSILDSSRHLGIVALNADYRIALFNPAAENFFSVSKNEVVGRPLEVVMDRLPILPPQASSVEHIAETVWEMDSLPGKPDNFFENRISPVVTEDGSQLGTVFTSRDITEQKLFTSRMQKLNDELEAKVRQRTKDLEYSRASLETAQRIASIGSWDWDMMNDRMIWSAQVYDIFGLSNEHFTPDKNSICDLAHPDDQELIKEAIKNLSLENPGYEIEYRIIRTDSEERVLKAIGQKFYDEQGEPSRVLGTLQDITDHVRLMEALTESKDAAEEASKAKSTFLANMSHEIRTPMNAIIGMSELLMETKLDKNQAKLMKTVTESAKSLMGILNDILDVSKLESGKMEIERVAFNLPTLVEDIANLVAFNAERKGLKVNTRFAKDMTRYVIGDPFKLRQVMINLMGNAVKFTEKGSVTIEVKHGKFPDEWHFCIIDTGIGISEKNIGKIFERFSQADESTTRRFGGTGLGTSISRGIIEAMNGSIWLESTEGVGSNFQFTLVLPEASDEQRKLVKIETSQQGAWTEPLHILLFEDNPVNQELIQIRMQQREHSVDIANDGVEGLEKFEANQYDLILMDIHMPKMNGLDATREIRRIEQQQGGHIPIIILSASILEEDQRKCMEVGADEFSWKPIDFTDLYNKIGKFFATKQKDNEPASELIDEVPDLDLQIIDIKEGLKLWQDMAMYKKVIKSFIRDYANVVEKLQAISARKDVFAGKELLHALKGVAGNLGIKQLTMIGNQLEDVCKAGEILDESHFSRLSLAMQQVITDAKMIEEFEIKPSDSYDQTIDLAAAVLMLDKLIESLEQSELDDDTFDSLHNLISSEQIKPIEDAIDHFDFEKALLAAMKLKQTLSIDENNEESVSSTELDIAKVLGLLDTLIAALQQSEFDDEAMETLHHMLDNELLRPLEESIDSFDFVTAIVKAKELKTLLTGDK